MSPRTYRSPRRSAQQEGLRQRIVEAAVALHAEKGGLGTTMPDIARKADVAIPTVYKYFPDLDSIIPACTGHVFAQAPPLDATSFERVLDLPGRIHVLVRGAFAQRRHFEPWLRWGEAEHIPKLKELHLQSQNQLRGIIELSLAPAFAGKIPASLLALVESLLSFGAWQILHSRLSPRKALAATQQAILTLTLEASHGHAR